MDKGVSNTSPLLYLHRIGGLPWLRELFAEVWVPQALALENPDRVVLLDDSLARRIGQAAGLRVWGTLKILLEAKARGLTDSITPLLDGLEAAGMWISQDIRNRILILAGERLEK